MDDSYKDNHTTLPNDNHGDVPFSEPDDIRNNNRPDTHPQTDTNVDADEVYQEGLDTATRIDPKAPEEETFKATDNQ